MMNKIDFLKNSIKDNNYEGLSLQSVHSNIENNTTKQKKSVFDILKSIYNEYSLQNIKDLTTTITFDEEFDANENQKLFELKGNSFEDAKIFTFNLVGTLVYQEKLNSKPVIFNINSRFGNEFLQYMIASSNGFLELENSGGFSNDVSLAEWIFIYYFKIKLKDAFNLGMYKTYTSKTQDLLSLRGKVDINYFIKKETFDGKTRCTYKDHSYSNEINYVISLAINKVFKKYQAIVQDLHTIKNAFNQIEYKKQNIKFLNNKKVKNPFYSKYNEVFKLAHKILQDDFGSTGKENFSAFLFDISLLFEHHIRILLKQRYKIGIKNEKEFKVPNGVGENPIYPDIIIYNDDGSISIYDVKYKHFKVVGKDAGVKREDRFQMISYVAIYAKKYKIKECGFIYPLKFENENKKDILEVQILKVFNMEIPFKIKFYSIAQNENKVNQKDNWKSFIKSQKKFDDLFLDAFSSS